MTMPDKNQRTIKGPKIRERNRWLNKDLMGFDLNENGHSRFRKISEGAHGRTASHSLLQPRSDIVKMRLAKGSDSVSTCVNANISA